MIIGKCKWSTRFCARKTTDKVTFSFFCCLYHRREEATLQWCFYHLKQGKIWKQRLSSPDFIAEGKERMYCSTIISYQRNGNQLWKKGTHESVVIQWTNIIRRYMNIHFLWLEGLTHMKPILITFSWLSYLQNKIKCVSLQSNEQDGQ